MYTPVFNGVLVVILKKGKHASPAEILEIESFLQRWQPCLKKKDDELSAEKALTELNKTAEEEEEEDEVTKLLRGSVEANPNRYKKGSIEHCWATASQTLGIYCTLVTEPDTEGQLTKLIQESALGPGLKGTTGNFGDQLTYFSILPIIIYLSMNLITSMFAF